MRASSLLGGFFLLISLGRLCAQLPDMRPASFEAGSSLANLIDADSLMKQGQTDAQVMFTCGVSDFGRPTSIVIYRGTPNSKLLGEEAVKKFRRAAFVPAVYHHKNRQGAVYGTIVFRIISGKPQLRVYLNQEAEHLKKEDDFIAPQPVYVPGGKYRGMPYPHIGYSATVELKLNFDATGKLTSSKVILEDPPGKGFGNELLSKIGDVAFVPGFLHGNPVACSSTLHLMFEGAGHRGGWTD